MVFDDNSRIIFAFITFHTKFLLSDWTRDKGKHVRPNEKKYIWLQQQILGNSKVLGMGYVILLWHSLSLPYNYLE